MENNSSENLNNNMIYNDNNIQNYEELACCSNSLITTFIQENGNYILNYINDLCFKDVSIDDEAQIVNNPNQKLETPLCSNNKNNNYNNPNNNIFITNNIENQINNRYNQNYKNNNNNQNNINQNNQNNQNNNHSLNNSLHSQTINNPSNDSAAEPIMSDQKYRENIFTKIKNVFKDFFSDKKEENQNKDNISGSALNININNRLELKRGGDNNILALSQFNQNLSNQRNRQNNYNALKNTNSNVLKRPRLFADNILSFNISEENDDEALKLVSFIPVFTVKEKNKTDEDMNKCTICLTDFEIGDKKSTLPCLHSFHSNCIEKWIKKKKYCPICKFQISLESLKESLEQL